MTRSSFAALVVLCLLVPVAEVQADLTAQTLPFSQDWTNIGLITVDNNWDGVPGIIGYRGDNLTTATGTDARTIVADGSGTPINVEANETAPNTFATGGVIEFHITNPVVALNGSGTADAPHIVINLNTTANVNQNITISYNVRDIDGSADNAIQQVALQYRIGSTGDYTNLAAGYVADATTAGSATQVTAVSATLPSNAAGQGLVQVRIITTNAVGNDESVGIDDIQVMASNVPTLNIDDVTVAEGDSGTVSATFTVSLTSTSVAPVTFDISTMDQTATAGSDYVAQALMGQMIPAGQTSYMFSVVVNGDTAPEPTETFLVNVTNVSGATAGDVQGLGTITNDEPVLTIADASVIEGNAGPVLLTFTAMLDRPAGVGGVSFEVATADGTATQPSDYSASTQTVTIPQNAMSADFSVTVNGDTTNENDETFTVTVNPASVTGALVGDGTATGTIINDDVAPPRPITALGVAVTENFDSLANTGTTNSLLPLGFALNETGGGARDNERYAADNGASNTGDTYSYGATGDPERALGGLQSGTLVPTIGAQFINNTGSTITTLLINYTGEQWRLGNAGRFDQIDFQLSTNATSLATGSWTDYNALDFISPNTLNLGQLNGNDPANQATPNTAITGLSIPDGATFWIRWLSSDASGADDGLAVDDFSLTADTGTAIVLTVNDINLLEGDAGTTPATFTISLSAPAGSDVTFDIATADGTATVADNDYVANAAVGLTIPAGMTSVTFDVLVNGDTATESSENFFVNITNVTGALVNDAQGMATIVTDDVTLTPIYTIQGSGPTSPLAGMAVTTRGIVTALRSNGYFIQDQTGDANTTTSDGIFVFTSSTPPAEAAIGNLVQVSGSVVEFVPGADPNSPPLTELGNFATTALISTGNPLPAPVTLTPADTPPGGDLHVLEEYEGMRVLVPSLTVVAPTSGATNETNATGGSNGLFFGVITTIPRPFREPGIPVPDPVPPPMPPNVPRFDANTERIRVDSDAQPGALQLDVATGATLTNLIGVVDYGFRTYTILPDAATPPVVTPGAAPTAVATPTADEATIASFNLQRFFDDVNDPAIGDPVLTTAAFNNRLMKASIAVRDFLKTPDILGTIEVENINALQALGTRINNDAVTAGQPNPSYMAFLIEGNDIGGIDVGFLIKSSLVSGSTPRVTVNAVVQEGDNATFVDPSDGSVDLLNDRPPLRLDAVVNFSDGRTFPVTVILVHQRSLNGANEDPGDGPRVRAKRRAQAEFLANLVQGRQTANPSERIVILGDFNAFEFNDGLTDVMGTVVGDPTPPDQVVLASSDLVNPDLTNLVELEPQSERYSFLFDGNAQTLDHVVVNSTLIASTGARRVEHPRISSDFPETARNNSSTPTRLSDHDPVVAFFIVASATLPATDVTITKTAVGGPFLAGSNVTFNIAVTNSGPSMATNVVVTDVIPAGTTFVSASPTQGTCTGTTTVTCSVGTLAVSGTATIALVVSTTTTPAVYSNTATVASANTDIAPANNSSTVTVTTILVDQIPTLSEWALLALMAMLAGVAVVKMRT